MQMARLATLSLKLITPTGQSLVKIRKSAHQYLLDNLFDAAPL